jgi:AcrR family transcriptional regulator
MLYAVKPMPRPKSLALDDIAAAALGVAEREGLAGLSMRSVAEALGMGTMSLYRYVTDREHVERLMVDNVLSLVDIELSSRLGWRARVTTLLERARDAASAHATIVPLFVKHRSTSEHSTRWGEAMLRELADAGFSGTRRVVAFRTLVAYLLGSLQLAHLGSLAGEGTRRFAELPLDKYPVLAETARHAQRVDPDTEFRQGLAVILRGLETDV